MTITVAKVCYSAISPYEALGHTGVPFLDVCLGQVDRDTLNLFMRRHDKVIQLA